MDGKHQALPPSENCRDQKGPGCESASARTAVDFSSQFGSRWLGPSRRFPASAGGWTFVPLRQLCARLWETPGTSPAQPPPHTPEGAQSSVEF